MPRWAGQDDAGDTVCPRLLVGQSKSDDRSSFDDFWKIIRDDYKPAYSDQDKRYLRVTYARTCWTGIARSCGVHMGIEMQNKIAAVRERFGGKRLPQPISLPKDRCEALESDHNAPT